MRSEAFPLTPMQQAYWLGRQSDYALGGVGLHGYLELTWLHFEPERLRVAWKQLATRHPALRSIVTMRGHSDGRLDDRHGDGDGV